MPSKKENILEFNQYIKSDKIRHLIYADLKSLIKKICGCANNPEKLKPLKIGEHFICRFE